MFGGNSNWRGPIWFPLNYLLVSSIKVYGQFFGDSLTVEYPAGSGQHQRPRRRSPRTCAAAHLDLPARTTTAAARATARSAKLQDDPRWRDHVQFNEYFHGDNGAGLGASHQTGWTGLVADLIRRSPDSDVPGLSDLLQPGTRARATRDRRQHPAREPGALMAPTVDAWATKPGTSYPLGATPTGDGTNFAVASDTAEGMVLCLFDADGTEQRIPMEGFDAGVWHVFVPGVGPGARYGFRTTGPWDPVTACCAAETKLLLDPYARAIDGDGARSARRCSATRSTTSGAPERRSTRPARSRAAWWSTRPSTGRDDAPPRRSYADTIFYELHVKGFTQLHPGVPEPQRGTYAGLAHDAVIEHLVELGVTAVELLPVHHSVPEAFLVAEGLTNYWGYNTIGYFAPHAAVLGRGARRARPAARSTSSRRMVRAPPRAPGSRSSSTSCSTTPPRPDPSVRRCATGASTTPRYYRLDAGRSPDLRRHHRLRQLAQRGPPTHAAADHGLAALLGRGHARRRLPLRPRHRARPPGRWLRAVLRPSSTWSPRTRSCRGPS